jgi:hypothetical protein
MKVKATYTSVFDNSIVCESACDYDPATGIVSNIDIAENAEDADDANGLTDEYVTLASGNKLRKEDGVTFDY